MLTWSSLLRVSACELAECANRVRWHHKEMVVVCIECVEHGRLLVANEYRELRVN